MATNTEFQGFRVIVTGASSGIGLATVQHFHSRGASVALLARGKEALDVAVAELGERALGVTVDVTDDAALKAAIEESVCIRAPAAVHEPTNEWVSRCTQRCDSHGLDRWIDRLRSWEASMCW